MRSRSCAARKSLTMSSPNVNDTPRSFSPHPMMSRSGSDHSRSQSSPEVAGVAGEGRHGSKKAAQAGTKQGVSY